MVSDTLNNNDIVSLSFDVSETKEKTLLEKENAYSLVQNKRHASATNFFCKYTAMQSYCNPPPSVSQD